VFRTTIVLVQVLATGACSIGTGVALYVLLSYRVKQLERKFDNGINARITAIEHDDRTERSRIFERLDALDRAIAAMVATCKERWAAMKGHAADAD
jgi:hypothetical protein